MHAVLVKFECDLVPISNITVQVMKRHSSIIRYQSRVYASSRPACQPYGLCSTASVSNLSLGVSFPPYVSDFVTHKPRDDPVVIGIWGRIVSRVSQK